VYELTDYGADLEQAIMHLGRWGARALGEPRTDEIVTVDSLTMALRTTFRPEAADGLRASYELRIGPVVLHAQVDGPQVTVSKGPAPEPDLVIETGPALKALLARELSPHEALQQGLLQITGEPALLDSFVKVFRI
jgi:hypothetical protein